MNQNAYKVCPECGQTAGLAEMTCRRCGHTYRSQFGPVNQTQLVTPQLPPTAYGVGLKSKLAAALLGLFFGQRGVHNFYLGFGGRAVAQLLITVLTCGLGALITWPWALVESILILTGSINTDAQGLPLRD